MNLETIKKKLILWLRKFVRVIVRAIESFQRPKQPAEPVVEETVESQPKIPGKLSRFFPVNGKIMAAVCLVVLLLMSAYKIPHLQKIRKLTALGYSEAAITAIYDKGLTSTILNNELYSAFLNQEIVKDSFKKQYLELYLSRTSLNDRDLSLYERLKSIKKYSEAELNQLYASLNYENLLPLLVFDKLTDVEAYINDVRVQGNTMSSFRAKGDYLHAYNEPFITIDDKASIEAFVSAKSSLGDYVPENLTTLPKINAIEGIQMTERAAGAFNDLCAALRSEGLGMYAIGGFFSFERQQTLFDNLKSDMPGGFNDAQTGLGVTVTTPKAVGSKDISFKDTDEYKWLQEHGHEYGFIFRYGDQKEAITGTAAEYDYIRFVGTDLATAIHKSGLTFEEYYMLNLYNAQ